MSIVYTSETGVPTEREIDAKRQANAKLMRQFGEDTIAQRKRREFLATPYGKIDKIQGDLNLLVDEEKVTLRDYEIALGRIINLALCAGFVICPFRVVRPGSGRNQGKSGIRPMKGKS